MTSIPWHIYLLHLPSQLIAEITYLYEHYSGNKLLRKFALEVTTIFMHFKWRVSVEDERKTKEKKEKKNHFKFSNNLHKLKAGKNSNMGWKAARCSVCSWNYDFHNEAWIHKPYTTSFSPAPRPHGSICTFERTNKTCGCAVSVTFQLHLSYCHCQKLWWRSNATV